jgi:hypothetical protein
MFVSDGGRSSKQFARLCVSALVQAQARAHRIGQSREVMVLRLLAANTIEEHILDVAEQKRKFADSSITGMCVRCSASRRPVAFYRDRRRWG